MTTDPRLTLERLKTLRRRVSKAGSHHLDHATALALLDEAIKKRAVKT